MPAEQHYGLALPSRKQLTRDCAISIAPVPDQLTLPLNQHGDELLTPCIAPGESVRMGQIIARPRHEYGACIHAPVSGQVTALTHCFSARPCNVATPCIVLHNDHQDTPAATRTGMPDWSALNSIDLCSHLALGGIVCLGGAVFPVSTKVSAHVRQPIEQLIINGVECEPYITCDDRLMRERAEAIVQGVQILLHAAQAKQATIAVETDKPEALAALRDALQVLNDARITTRSVAHAYPAGDEAQLVRQLCNREIPRGKLPAEIGVIVSNVATVYACQQWIKQGKPLISRIVTVSGQGVSRPGNYETRIGTSMQFLLNHCGAENSSGSVLIMGGAMMGQALTHTDYPIIKASNCLIQAAPSELKPLVPEQPCIRCGECAHACPVHLLPQQLLAHARIRNLTALSELGLSDCIECGSCDYVCPSHIRLASRFHDAKQLNT